MHPDYFDIHSHLNFSDYVADIEEVIGRLKSTNTYTIVVGTDIESSKQAVSLADKHSQIYACVGVHPVDDPSGGFDEEEFGSLVKNHKVVAIGECGLDFFHQDKSNSRERVRQEHLFLKHIDLALTEDKPLMIHSRDAYSDLLDILEPLAKIEGGKLRGNVHFFAGDIDTARRFFNIGFTVSFTGVITFARDYDEVIKFSPLDMIMSETDAPYVSPTPFRGRRNEPVYVSEVVKKIAEIRGEDLEIVKKVLVENALRVFNVKL